jgi:hypothetical protein
MGAKDIERFKMKKGTTLNPNGRPKGSRNRSTIVREILAMKGAIPEEVFEELKKIFPEINNKMSIEEIMTISIVNKAVTESDVTAYKALMDSGYGAPVQQVEQKQTNIDLSHLSTDDIVNLLKEDEQ